MESKIIDVAENAVEIKESVTQSLTHDSKEVLLDQNFPGQVHLEAVVEDDESLVGKDSAMKTLNG